MHGAHQHEPVVQARLLAYLLNPIGDVEDIVSLLRRDRLVLGERDKIFHAFLSQLSGIIG
jgi:hypothetical protein